MDLFSTATMLEVVKEREDEVQGQSSFLRDTFFKRVETFSTEQVCYDYTYSKRDMAQFSHPRVGGTALKREGFETRYFIPPELAPEMVTTVDNLIKRTPGEAIGGSLDPMQRAAKQLGDDLRHIDDTISRREEWMCAEALLTGGIDFVGEGINDSVLYWTTRNGGVGDPYTALTSTALWSAHSTCDPLADFNTAVRAIVQQSGVSPDVCIMGSQAYDNFIQSDIIQKYLDNRRINLGDLPLSVPMPAGVRHQGTIAGLDILTYDAWYFDESQNAEVPMFDPEKILIASTKQDNGFMAYGAVALMGREPEDAPRIYAERRVPDSYIQRKNPAGRIVQIKSRPLPVITRKNAFYVYTVL